MAVGVPWIENIHRRVERQPINPLDVCTIVSIFPREIKESKPTLLVPEYYVPAGTFENPGMSLVMGSSWWRELGDDQPMLEIPQSSIIIANSIVNDYCNGLMGCNMADAMPGLFFLPGKVDKAELITKYKQTLETARAKQKRWYLELVKLADSLWARSNGNPLTISDIQRLAASELGFKTKEWLQDFQNVEMVRCIACGSMRNPNFPICSVCKAIADPEKATKLGIKFAQ